MIKRGVGVKIMIAAGGTGGHVNPALAVAGEIKKRYPEAEICFVGTPNRIEAKIVPEAGYPLKTIEKWISFCFQL